jgi:hypothetical protein
VPLTVSNNDFWRRYYFRCHILEEEEARRVEVMKRAENVHGDDEKEIGWEDEGMQFIASYSFSTASVCCLLCSLNNPLSLS